jgi:hypothetical protein
MAQQHPVDQVFLIIEASYSHSDISHSVGLLWTSDRGLYLTKHNTHNRQTSMTPAGFEPAVLASERPKTNYVECVANGIDERPCAFVELF